MSERFRRHEIIPGWDQSALRDAKVIVVGVGAVGNEVARVLAMSGVGSLLLCDPDKIEESNLSRTTLFGSRDVGRFKVEAAAEALASLSPGIAIDTRPVTLIAGIGLGELRDARLTISCLDTRSARLQLTGRCALVRAPMLDGGTYFWGGEIRPYLDPDGPCYGCRLTEAERGVADSPWSCRDVLPEENPAAAPWSAAVGALMASTALRYLMGLPFPNSPLHLDLSSGTTTVSALKRDPTCPLHESLPPPRPTPVSSQSTVAELRAALPSNWAPLLWNPVIFRVDCPACGFTENVWKNTVDYACPQCREMLRECRTIEIEAAPGEIVLSDLGIPPREILTIVTPAGLEWVEFQS